MKKRKVAINLGGPSCSGKSTLTKYLSKRLKESRIVSYDKLKWHIDGHLIGFKDLKRKTSESDYKGYKHSLKELTLGLFELACEENLTILLDTPISTEREYKEYEKIAKKFGYKIININLTCNKSVLVQRFHKRVKDHKKKGKRLSVSSEELFLKKLSRKFYVPKGEFNFDTSNGGIEEFARMVLKSF